LRTTPMIPPKLRPKARSLGILQPVMRPVGRIEAQASVAEGVPTPKDSRAVGVEAQTLWRE
jgi:hypothetical protein